MDSYQTLNEQHEQLRQAAITLIQAKVAAGDHIRNYVVIGKVLVQELHSDWVTLDQGRPVMYQTMETGTLLEILRNLSGGDFDGEQAGSGEEEEASAEEAK